MSGETDLEATAKLRIGTVLRGKYRLERLLGVGGMAVVYKATHRNQAEFAVKMLHPELSIRAEIRTRFLREGYAANSVKHPGAVLVVDDDVSEDGAAFLVMELLDGQGVEQLWEGARLRMPPLQAAAIVSQLLDVLAAAHAKGIVHRDIKPANLFVTRDGTVKVLDFGIARARDALAQGASATGTGTLLGTPAFMPPEQALAKASDIDGQTDVWAAGATLFTLVSGCFVHEGDNGPQLMIRAATAPARSLASVAAVPPALVQVVDRALAFEKASRWPTATAMRDALDEACRASFGQAPSKALLAMGAAPASVGAAEPQHGRVASEAELAATAHAAVQTPALPIPQAGGTTAGPLVTAPSPASIPGVRRRTWAFPLIAAAITLVGAVAFVSTRAGRGGAAGSDPVSAQGAPSVPSAAASTAPAAPPASESAPAAPPSPSVTASAAPAVSAPTTKPAPRPNRPAIPSATAPVSTHASPAAPAPPPPSPSAKGNALDLPMK